MVVCLLAIAVSASVAYYTTYASRPKLRVLHLPYTTADVVEYLVFSAGRVVVDFPVLQRTDQKSVAVPSATQLHIAAESLTECIRSVDASAGSSMTAAFNAADPERLDGALRRFNAAANRWLSTPHKAESPCPPPPPPPSVPPDSGSGDGVWKMKADVYGAYLVAGWLVAAAGVSATVGAVFNVLVAAMATLVVAATAVLVAWIFPVLITYEFEAAPKDLDRQIAVAKIVQALRS